MIWGRRILPFGVITIALAALFPTGRVSPLAAVQQPPAAGGTSEPTTGTPGSPTATTTINGEQLPPPPQKFEGIINQMPRNRNRFGRRGSSRRRVRRMSCSS